MSRASLTTKSVAEIGAEHQLKTKSTPLHTHTRPPAVTDPLLCVAVKEINNMHLQNVMMQLRKVGSHPILFEGPRMNQQVMYDELVDASGKVMILERLLDALFARGHKVLVFSRFVTMLDVIEVSRSALRVATLLIDHDRAGRTSTTRAGHCAECAASTARRAHWNAAQRWIFSRRAAARQTHRASSSYCKHARRRARYQPDRSRHDRILRRGLGA
jgi:hypothetical protein